MRPGPVDRATWRELARELKDELSRDAVTDLAASVTYYGVLALFPFLLLLVALASLVITPAQAEGMVAELSRVAPGPVTEIAGERVRQLGQQQRLGIGGHLRPDQPRRRRWRRSSPLACC